MGKGLKYLVEQDGELISIRVPDGATDETLDGASLYAQVEPLLRAAESPRLLLHDLRGTPQSPVRRKRFAEWVTANRELVERSVAAYAVVAQSRLQGGMITAVLWVVEPPVTWKAFTETSHAIEWLRGHSTVREDA